MVSKQDLPFHPYRHHGPEPDIRHSSASVRLGTETSLDKTITEPARHSLQACWGCVSSVFGNIWTGSICITRMLGNLKSQGYLWCLWKTFPNAATTVSYTMSVDWQLMQTE